MHGSFYNGKCICFSSGFIRTKLYFSMEDSGSLASILCQHWAY